MSNQSPEVGAPRPNQLPDTDGVMETEKTDVGFQQAVHYMLEEDNYNLLQKYIKDTAHEHSYVTIVDEDPSGDKDLDIAYNNRFGIFVAPNGEIYAPRSSANDDHRKVLVSRVGKDEFDDNPPPCIGLPAYDGANRYDELTKTSYIRFDCRFDVHRVLPENTMKDVEDQYSKLTNALQEYYAKKVSLGVDDEHERDMPGDWKRKKRDAELYFNRMTPIHQDNPQPDRDSLTVIVKDGVVKGAVRHNAADNTDTKLYLAGDIVAVIEKEIEKNTPQKIGCTAYQGAQIEESVAA